MHAQRARLNRTLAARRVCFLVSGVFVHKGACLIRAGHHAVAAADAPTLPFAETDERFEIKDSSSDGIDIQFAKSGEETLKTDEKEPLTLSFPKDYAKPIEVKLDPERVITITDLSGSDGYTASTLTTETIGQGNQGFFDELLKEGTEERQSYLRYQSDDERKSLLYALQKDGGTGEKKLKHWTIYEEGTGLETEEYQFENAKLKINDKGEAEVFNFGQKEIQNEAVKVEVDSDLMARAQRTIAKEMGEDILNGGQTPDFTIPAPYYLDRLGEKHEATWQWNEERKDRKSVV